MKITHTSIYCFLIAVIFIACNTSQPEELKAGLQEVESPAAPNSSLPYLIHGQDGKLYLSWVEKKMDSNWVVLKYSRLGIEGWSDPEMIAKGNDWFANWADYPMISVDTEGNKIAHYLAKSDVGTYSYNVNVVIKAKDSANWSRAIIPHTDGTPTEHGFVTMIPNNNSTFTLAWLDGRNTGGGDHSGHGGSNSAMTLRTAIIDLQGNISQEAELDNRVCDCCQTSGVMTSDGPVFVYRDRSVDEVRDMAYVTKKDSIWVEPKLVAMDNWNIAGCPVNGPRMDASDSTIAVAWYTAALSRPKIKVAFKSGDDFEAPIIIDETSPVGRVDLSMIDDQTAAVSWLDGGKQSAIKYRIVSRNGSMSPVYVVALTSEERGSGFPQMEYHNNALFFAWTEMGNVDQIRMKKVILD